MAVADDRQRYMPLPDDRLPERSKVLDVPEAVLLVNPIEPEFQGEVINFFSFIKHFIIKLMQPSRQHKYSLILICKSENTHYNWMKSFKKRNFLFLIGLYKMLISYENHIYI